MTPEALDTTTSLVARLGGATTVDGIVETFYANMEGLEEARGIRVMHGADLEPARSVLKSDLAEWLGEPRTNSAQRGHPRMRHSRFAIGPSERDAWLACRNKALDQAVADAVLREALRLNFRSLADWMRNDSDNPHDRRR